MLYQTSFTCIEPHIEVFQESKKAPGEKIKVGVGVQMKK